jgi:outer membrane autotransporter protein
MGNVTGGLSLTGDANFNVVNISGASDVKGNVTGGLSGSGEATYNVVTLSDSARLNANLSGGLVGEGGDAYTGNRLRLVNFDSSASSIDKVENFEYYDFVLPASASPGFIAFTANEINLGPRASLGSLEFLGAQPLLAVGDTITLLKAAKMIGYFQESIIENASMGLLFAYDFKAYQDTDDTVKIKALSSPAINPQSKTLTETSAASLAFLNQGHDLIADKGLALAAAKAAAKNGLAVFVGIEGGQSRYKTGSHVDLKGVNGLLGVSMVSDFDRNRLTLGLFGEFGFGSYDSQVSGNNFQSLEAEGDVSYVGGGVISRFDIQQTAGTLYLEASGRIGNSKADFTAKNFRLANREAKYDISGTYFGAHAGVGYDIRLSESLYFDVYFKYFWNKQNGSDAKVLGSSFTLNDVYSSRIRTGGRLKLDFNGFIKPYVGGAYIHEFKGETGAKAYGYNIPNADLKGGSTMVELGVTILKGDSMPISVDIGAQGYFGDRRGLSGSLNVKYEF